MSPQAHGQNRSIKPIGLSNLVNSNEEVNIDQSVLKVKTAYVDGGPVMKRFRAASMGRASRLRRPTSHITIVVSRQKGRN